MNSLRAVAQPVSESSPRELCLESKALVLERKVMVEYPPCVQTGFPRWKEVIEISWTITRAVNKGLLGESFISVELFLRFYIHCGLQLPRQFLWAYFTFECIVDYALAHFADIENHGLDVCW